MQIYLEEYLIWKKLYMVSNNILDKRCIYNNVEESPCSH